MIKTKLIFHRKKLLEKRRLLFIDDCCDEPSPSSSWEDVYRCMGVLV